MLHPKTKHHHNTRGNTFTVSNSAIPRIAAVPEYHLKLADNQLNYDHPI